MLIFLLLPALAATPTAPELATWSTATGIALASVPEPHQMQLHEGTLVVQGPGTSLLLQLDQTPQQVLDAQVAPFVAAGIAAPTWTSGPCTIDGEASTCLSGVLQVAPGAEMRLMAGRSAVEDYTAACLDRKVAEGWPAPCEGVIGG